MDATLAGAVLVLAFLALILNAAVSAAEIGRARPPRSALKRGSETPRRANAAFLRHIEIEPAIRRSCWLPEIEAPIARTLGAPSTEIAPPIA